MSPFVSHAAHLHIVSRFQREARKARNGDARDPETLLRTYRKERRGTSMQFLSATSAKAHVRTQVKSNWPSSCAGLSVRARPRKWFDARRVSPTVFVLLGVVFARRLGTINNLYYSVTTINTLYRDGLGLTLQVRAWEVGISVHATSQKSSTGLLPHAM